MKLRRGRGRPVYVVKKLMLLKNREAANLSQERNWRTSATRAGFALLDLDLLSFHIEKHVTVLGTTSDDMAEADELEDELMDEDEDDR